MASTQNYSKDALVASLSEVRKDLMNMRLDMGKLKSASPQSFDYLMSKFQLTLSTDSRLLSILEGTLKNDTN